MVPQEGKVNEPRLHMGEDGAVIYKYIYIPGSMHRTAPYPSTYLNMPGTDEYRIHKS